MIKQKLTTKLDMAQPKFCHVIFKNHHTGLIDSERITMASDVLPTAEQIRSEAERVFTLPEECWTFNKCGCTAKRRET